MSLYNAEIAQAPQDRAPVVDLPPESLWRKTHLPLGLSMLMGAAMESAYSVAANCLRLGEARMAKSPELMQQACEAMAEDAQRTLVLAELLARKLAEHRKRNPLAGVR